MVDKITFKSLSIETFPIGNFQCNCTLIYSDSSRECIAIDPGNDQLKFLEKIQNLNLNVRKILHTHAHFDHIGKSQEIKKELGSSLYLHKEDLFLYKNLKEQAQFFSESVGNVGPIDHYLEDEDNIPFEDINIKFMLKTLHTPGHTPGSCCFYSENFQSPILFSGDTLFFQSIGRTDFPGGNFDQIKKSIKDRLFYLPGETLVIPGHGPETQINFEKKSNPFV